MLLAGSDERVLVGFDVVSLTRTYSYFYAHTVHIDKVFSILTVKQNTSGSRSG